MAVNIPWMLLSSLRFHSILFPQPVSFFFRAPACLSPSRPNGGASSYASRNSNLPSSCAFFHPWSWSTVQNENTQLIASPVPLHAIPLCPNYGKDFPSRNVLSINSKLLKKKKKMQASSQSKIVLWNYFDFRLSRSIQLMRVDLALEINT